MRKLLLLLIFGLSVSAVAQRTPSNTYCDPSIPIYAYNGVVYTCYQGVPVSSGAASFPGVVSDGSNGLTVTSNITAATVSSNVNSTIYVKAPPYNAKCDGVTDDQTAIQSAFTTAYSTGQQIQFPAGTCLTSTIVWKGQSFFGAGTGLTFIKGQPGQDIFQTPDSSVSLQSPTTVHDLTLLVDASVDASATAAGGNNTFPNRIAGTVQNMTAFTVPIAPGPLVIGFGTCAGHGFTIGSGTPSTVTVSCGLTNDLAAINSSRVVGAPITVDGAGTTYSVTAWSITSNVATFTATNAFSAGDTVVLNGFGTSTFFNGLTPYKVLAAGLSGSQFEIAFTHANGSATENGNAVASLITTIATVGTFVSPTQTLTLNASASTFPTNGTGSMLNAITPPWYAGNAALAFQCSNGSSCPGNILNAKFYNLQILPTGITSGLLQYNHVVGVFTQLAQYNSSWTNVNINNTYGCYWEAPPPSGRVLTGDTSLYRNFNCSLAAVPDVFMNGNDRVIDGLYIYASGGVQSMGPFFLTTGQTLVPSLTWTVNSLYVEGANTQSGEVARFMGGPLTFNAANLLQGAPTQAYVEWLATGSQYHGLMGATIKVAAGGNLFEGTRLINANITDTGQDNLFVNPYISGSNSYMNRKFNPSSLPYQDPVGKLDGSFILSGNSAAPYNNASDLFTTCKDWGFPNNPANAIGTCSNDPTGTEIGRSYFQSSSATENFNLLNGGTAAVNAWSGASRLFGSQSWPTTKGLAVVQAQCVGCSVNATATFRIKDATSGAQLGTGSVSFGTSWTIQKFAVDLTSATVGDVVNPTVDTWTNNGTAYQISAIWFEPYNQDQLAGLTVVDSTGAGLTTGPTSATNLDAVVFDGTTGKIKDAGTALPPATVTSIPASLQSFGDGSEGALSCTGGTTCTAIQAGEHWYSSINISNAGSIQPISTSSETGAPTILRATGTCTISATLSGSANTGASSGIAGAGNYGGGGGGGGFGAANGTAGNNYVTAAATGGGAGGTSGVTGGTGTALPAQLQKLATDFLCLYGPSNSQCGGSAGGQGGSSGGAGGKGGMGIFLVCQTINFTGTIDVSGQNGGAGGLNTGGGGGGSGGFIVMRSPNMTNSGTIIVTHGSGGAIGTGTSTAGGNGPDGWIKVFSN